MFNVVASKPVTGLVQADYTVASWTALTDAIAADKAAIDAKTTVAEVTSYTLTGTAAKAALGGIKGDKRNAVIKSL